MVSPKQLTKISMRGKRKRKPTARKRARRFVARRVKARTRAKSVVKKQRRKVVAKTRTSTRNRAKATRGKSKVSTKRTKRVKPSRRVIARKVKRVGRVVTKRRKLSNAVRRGWETRRKNQRAAKRNAAQKKVAPPDALRYDVNGAENYVIISFPYGSTFSDKLKAIAVADLTPFIDFHDNRDKIPGKALAVLYGTDPNKPGSQYFMRHASPLDMALEPEKVRAWITGLVENWATNYKSRQDRGLLSDADYDAASTPDNLQSITVKYFYPPDRDLTATT